MPSPGQTKRGYSLRPLGAAPADLTAFCAGATYLGAFYFDAQIEHSERHACLKGQGRGSRASPFGSEDEAKSEEAVSEIADRHERLASGEPGVNSGSLSAAISRSGKSIRP